MDKKEKKTKNPMVFYIKFNDTCLDPFEFDEIYDRDINSIFEEYEELNIKTITLIVKIESNLDKDKTNNPKAEFDDIPIKNFMTLDVAISKYLLENIQGFELTKRLYALCFLKRYFQKNFNIQENIDPSTLSSDEDEKKI